MGIEIHDSYTLKHYISCETRVQQQNVNVSNGKLNISTVCLITPHPPFAAQMPPSPLGEGFESYRPVRMCRGSGACSRRKLRHCDTFRASPPSRGFGRFVRSYNMKNKSPGRASSGRFDGFVMQRGSPWQPASVPPARCRRQGIRCGGRSFAAMPALSGGLCCGNGGSSDQDTDRSARERSSRGFGDTEEGTFPRRQPTRRDAGLSAPVRARS